MSVRMPSETSLPRVVPPLLFRSSLFRSHRHGQNLIIMKVEIMLTLHFRKLDTSQPFDRSSTNLRWHDKTKGEAMIRFKTGDEVQNGGESLK
jgi:hypothetical protein